MITLTTPNGLPVNVPETLAEDRSPKFDFSQIALAQEYYRENGYVVFKNLISQSNCDKARDLWNKEVKPSSRFIYRQATAKAERNVLNRNGWVMNPILNLQSLNPDYFGQLRQFATDSILACDALRTAFNSLLGDNPKIVQSMYFEGNSATWEHQDSYYLDSVNIGSMAAAWIALEDISAMAGRFFICPGTHKLELERQNKDTNVASNHQVYIDKVVSLMKKDKMEIRAPLLEKGDVLFWNAWTIHGSLKSEDNERSRSSITCHAIPGSDLFLQLQTRSIDVPYDEINGVKIWRPKDQAVFTNKFVMFMESRFPKLFYALKNAVIRIMVR